jgi:predicted nuclease of predicted toxin-antitoxin system
MRILADENFPGDAVSALREGGHDVLWVCMSMPGASDSEILKVAQNDRRIVLTLDKDFGELAFRLQNISLSGVILFRMKMLNPQMAVRKMVQVLESRTDWEGYFSVVEEDRVRMRPLPTKS